MSRSATYLWRLLVALGEVNCALGYWYPMSGGEARREFEVDLADEASVRAAFNAIVEWEWGAAGFRVPPPGRRHSGTDERP